MNVSKKRVSAPRKTYKKAKKAYSALTPARRSFPPIAPRPAGGNGTLATFIYTSKFSLDPGTLGTAALYQFRLNSLFDPDLTGVGAQPVGFDQYAALYEKYRVYETSYKVSFSNTSNLRTSIVGVSTSDDNTTTSDVDRIIQNGQCEWELIGQAGSWKDKVTFTGTVDMASAQGVSRKAFWDDDLNEALFSANPNEAYTLNCFAADLSTGDPGSINCFIEIRYKARLYGNVLTITS